MESGGDIGCLAKCFVERTSKESGFCVRDLPGRGDDIGAAIGQKKTGQVDDFVGAGVEGSRVAKRQKDEVRRGRACVVQQSGNLGKSDRMSTVTQEVGKRWATGIYVEMAGYVENIAGESGGERIGAEGVGFGGKRRVEGGPFGIDT